MLVTLTYIITTTVMAEPARKVKSVMSEKTSKKERAQSRKLLYTSQYWTSGCSRELTCTDVEGHGGDMETSNLNEGYI